MAIAASASAQLLNGYLGDEPGPKSWTIDVATGEFQVGGGAISRAAAFDIERNWSFSVVDARRSSDTVRLNIGGEGSPANPLLFTQGGSRVFRITALAFGDGVLYGRASFVQTPTKYLVAIDIETGVMDLLLTEDEIGGEMRALTYDHDRDELLAALPGGIFALDPATGETEFVANGSGDGLAYGYNRVYMVCGSSNACGAIGVYNRRTERFEPRLPLPPRNGNGASGSTFDPNSAVSPPPMDFPERQVQIRSVDFVESVIEIHNFSAFAFNLEGWRLCSHDFAQPFNYTGGFDDRTLAPGGSLFIHLNNDKPFCCCGGCRPAINASELGGSFALPLDQDAYAIQLFFTENDGTVSFGNSTLIADHIQWNVSGLGAGSAESRTEQAVDVGLWPAIGAFIATADETERIDLVDLSGDVSGSPVEYEVTPFVDVCAADVDGDGATDTADITLVVSNLGAGSPSAQGTPGDANGDGETDTADITFVVSNLGCVD